MTAPADAPWGLKTLVALTVITLGGAALRAYRLDAADLWLDEANTVRIASLPLVAMLRELAAEDVHPPLFYLLVKAPLALWQTELGLRLLPWLFGVLCIPLAYLVAQDLAGRAAGLTAAALAAASAPLVIFSQEGRMYTLLALLELLAAWSLLRALESGGRAWWARFVLASVAALYTHNIAGLFLLAHLGVALRAGRDRAPTVIAGAACLALYAPWLPTSVGQALRVQATGGWLGSPPPLWLPVATLLNLLGGSEARDGLLSPRFALEHLYLFGGAVALLAFGWRRLQARPRAREVLLATALVPVALSLALSQLTRIYIDKTFLVGSLLLVIVMAAAVPAGVSKAGRAAPLAAAALVVLAGLWAVPAHWMTPRESYRALVSDLLAQVQPGDTVLAVPGFLSRPVGYYLDRAGSALEVREANATSPDHLRLEESPRLWVVSGGAWDQIPVSQAALAWRERARYAFVHERLYPDAGLRLTLYRGPS